MPIPNHNTHYLILNIDGTSGLKCGCGSWINHWRRFTRGTRNTCSVLGCQRTDIVGAHVLLADNRRNSDWWIVPLCNKHNHYQEGMWIDSRTKLASADPDVTCLPDDE